LIRLAAPVTSNQITSKFQESPLSLHLPADRVRPEVNITSIKLESDVSTVMLGHRAPGRGIPTHGGPVGSRVSGGPALRDPRPQFGPTTRPRYPQAKTNLLEQKPAKIQNDHERGSSALSTVSRSTQQELVENNTVAMLAPEAPSSAPSRTGALRAFNLSVWPDWAFRRIECSVSPGTTAVSRAPAVNLRHPSWPGQSGK
jgi:hypothetical protein